MLSVPSKPALLAVTEHLESGCLLYRLPITRGIDKAVIETLVQSSSSSAASPIPPLWARLASTFSPARTMWPRAHLAYERQDADEAAYVFPQLPWATMWKTQHAKQPTRERILDNSDLPNY